MRTVVRSAVLIAFSVACGYAKLLLFPYLFFVELFTVAVFLSGILVGPMWGAWVGAVARLAFSLANPYGPPHPWVLAAQILGAAWIGAVGGLAGKWLLDRGVRPDEPPGMPAPRRGTRLRIRTLILLTSALLCTLVYDLVTNVAQGIVFGSIPAALALAVVPSIQHLASNLAIFAVIGSLAVPWLDRHPALSPHAA
ncbi:MAG TPA: hypothetical protein VFP58_07035 [Candidatus Eisenbacteria bacterium]|nr:hypothetical protein [Candidatus Eisenbacteria bacterium]